MVSYSVDLSNAKGKIMASNTFGNIFRITTWGESHGKAIGVVIDGVPAGVPITVERIISHLKWRRPGQALTSPRKEPDEPIIESGVFDGYTTGAPISIIIRNKDAKKTHYDDIKHIMRPGHANFTYINKYSVFDHHGGGRASARETACRVAAGAIAEAILEPMNIRVAAYVSSAGSITMPDSNLPADIKIDTITQSPVFCPDPTTSERISDHIQTIAQQGDSVGGTVNFLIQGCPAGLGDPIYHKLEALLAYAMLSIPASKGFEIGSGFNASTLTGSQHNDSWHSNDQQQIEQTSNNCGGILGGISTGAPIYGKVAFKPTSSIKKSQQTIDTSGNNTTLTFAKHTRHDPCVAIRAVAVVKAMCLITLADAYLSNKTAKV